MFVQGVEHRAITDNNPYVGRKAKYLEEDEVTRPGTLNLFDRRKWRCFFDDIGQAREAFSVVREFLKVYSEHFTLNEPDEAPTVCSTAGIAAE